MKNLYLEFMPRDYWKFGSWGLGLFDHSNAIEYINLKWRPHIKHQHTYRHPSFYNFDSRKVWIWPINQIQYGASKKLQFILGYSWRNKHNHLHVLVWILCCGWFAWYLIIYPIVIDNWYWTPVQVYSLLTQNKIKII